MDVKKAAAETKDYIVSIRREFHRHPELSLQEFRTAQRIEAVSYTHLVPFTCPPFLCNAFVSGDSSRGQTNLAAAGSVELDRFH